MVQADHTGRVDEHVTTALGNIALRPVQFLSGKNTLPIGQPGSHPPDIPEGSGKHPVTAVELPFFIDQLRPDQTGLLDILPGQKTRFKGNHRDGNTESRQLCFVLPQLREMGAAGQSAEVTVKNQQQPRAFIVSQMVHLPLTVGKRKRHRRFSGQIHGVSLSKITHAANKKRQVSLPFLQIF